MWVAEYADVASKTRLSSRPSFAKASEGDNLSCSRLKHDPLLAEMKKSRMAFSVFSTSAHIIYARGKVENMETLFPKRAVEKWKN